MQFDATCRRRWVAIFAAGGLALCIAGCGDTAGNVGLGVLGATAVGSYSPNNEIEQTYYLGVFDPQEQLPPAVYRVRVHGQASFISQTKFASGWVPSQVIDSLGTNVSFSSDSNQVKIDTESAGFTPFKPGRRLMLFGPEGFREAPPNHRLVILMGSSPEDFFQAIDESLGVVAQVTQTQGAGDLNRLLFESLVRIKAERERVTDLIDDTKQDLGESK